MDFDDDLTACAQAVEKGDPPRFRAVMAAPVAARRVLFPIYAFNLEVARAPWVTSEPMIGEMRLQWWRDALAEIEAGGVVRRHDVVTPLALALGPGLAERLDRLVGARRWDLYPEPFEDREHFDRYIEETGGLLLLAAARSLGEVDEEAALGAGYAAGLAAFLRAVPELRAKNRQPLLSEEHGQLAELAEQGLKRLAEARRAKVSKAARPAFLATWEAEPVLKTVRKDPAAVLEGRLEPNPAKSAARLAYLKALGRF
ncbi:squalene/phytoene synthase family protein [Roseivivax sp. GX 12232]|uniref:squalene/phytoene synthase family protein n=1 Tax=Roseivivax sp. GX 12232 TaxID=2900547 RepID=UPI001E39B78E|nr:squalene/phytoene synthase family protein [Roseivivax sp. GX 12232]MCE0504608.1 squalene/phytoene synthase family protein [Roseivivax sp. GX 12232]